MGRKRGAYKFEKRRKELEKKKKKQEKLARRQSKNGDGDEGDAPQESGPPIGFPD
jgi:hypothetical protein